MMYDESVSTSGRPVTSARNQRCFLSAAVERYELNHETGTTKKMMMALTSSTTMPRRMRFWCAVRWRLGQKRSRASGAAVTRIWPTSSAWSTCCATAPAQYVRNVTNAVLPVVWRGHTPMSCFALSSRLRYCGSAERASW